MELDGRSITTAKLDQAMTELVATLVKYGLDIVAAILILIIGWSLANWGRGFVSRRLSRLPRIDLTLVSFLSSFVKYAIMIITVIAVLSQFGVQTTSLIAVLGAAGLAVGLALQGTLSNVAAGVMLLIFRPFRVGDSVEVQGASGTVKEMSLFVTEINTSENIRIMVPNGLIWANAVKNMSVNPTRRIELTLGVAHEAKLDHVFSVLKDIMAADPRILHNPAAEVQLAAFGPSTLDLAIRAWTKTPDYWAVRFSLNKSIKERFEAEGIDIPYPHQVSLNQPLPPAAK
ncbi:mechanosensitive ion channel family protein [Govanella unica]|uniref:Small-conductance mechanosensitive channel n=1 Tax=Govanella unica TaxID=2975056 RepID=A0A9X3Z886_9PROT|nr:mechanosensitive ion channel domain-containing protein [Govania unica]MDA5194838.1 mechanosensitive ion channel [Govania unica]